MKKNLVFISILSLIFTIGCIANLKDLPREKCAATPGDNVMKAVKDNCIKCHEKDFSTRDGVCSLKPQIQDSVRSKRMPKIGTLWPDYYNTFMEWK